MCCVYLSVGSGRKLLEEVEICLFEWKLAVWPLGMFKKIQNLHRISFFPAELPLQSC